MDKSDIETSMLMDEFNSKAQLQQEFELLKPRLQDRARQIMGTIFILAFVGWAYPETFEQPVMTMLLVLILSTGTEIYYTNKKINKRMDVLYKLLRNYK